MRAILIACGLALVCSACMSARKKVDQELPGLRAQWQASVARQENLPVKDLDWPAALALLESNNLKLRRLRAEVTNSQENLRQVYRDLLPTLDVHATASHSLAHLNTVTFDDVTFSVDSFFNIPGLLNFNSRLFTARLSWLRALNAYELARREQAIELYKLFSAYTEANQLAQDIEADQTLAGKVQPVDELAARVLLEDTQTRAIGLQKQRETLQQSAADLLGSHQFFWMLQTNGLPVLPYDNQALALPDTNHVGVLQLRALAIELVGAWAQRQGLKLQYWPDLNIYITGPSVYTHDTTGNHFWDADQVRATADFFWRIDTRGNVGRQLRQTKREQDLQIARLREESVGLVARILAAQKIATSLHEQLARIEQLLPVVRQLPPPQSFTDLLNTIQTARSLRDQELKLRRELAELNTLPWFVDDRMWPPAKT